MLKRDKNGRFLKGIDQGYGFKRGNNPWNKGVECWKGREHPRGMLGKKHSEETKEQMTKARMGHGTTDITRRKISEKLKGRTGEKATNWQGGLSFEEYPREFNQKLKNKIRERDQFQCQFEGIHKGRLSIHHIDYNKENNNLSNLITLCIRHNGMANFHRIFWMTYFQNKIEERILCGNIL